jgi:hypothetical protein
MLTENRKTQSEVCMLLLQLRGGGPANREYKDSEKGMEGPVIAERREDMPTEIRKTQREVCKVLLQLRGGGEEPNKPTG